MKEDIILQQIKKIVQEILPESKVFLFGSRARGTSESHSDYDIMIVTKKSYDVREKISICSTVNTALADSGIPSDILLNSEDEIKKKERIARAYCTHHHERSDCLMNEDEKEYIRQWLYKANEDFSAVVELSDSELPLNGVICFHCQQSVEKFLKAFLIYKRQEVEKTHDVKFLRNLCCKLDPEFCEIDIKDINQFAVKARYPDDFLVPSDTETKVYIGIASQIKVLVEKKIRF